MKGGVGMTEVMEMDQFLLDLEEADELDTIESPWYIAIGGGAVLIVIREK